MTLEKIAILEIVDLDATAWLRYYDLLHELKKVADRRDKPYNDFVDMWRLVSTERRIIIRMGERDHIDLRTFAAEQPQ